MKTPIIKNKAKPNLHLDVLKLHFQQCLKIQLNAYENMQKKKSTPKCVLKQQKCIIDRMSNICNNFTPIDQSQYPVHSFIIAYLISIEAAE